jgi:hypothetical protein
MATLNLLQDKALQDTLKQMKASGQDTTALKQYTTDYAQKG